MTFTSGIPATGQSLGSSRSQVAGNFANYNTVMSVNHVAPNASGQGKHNFVEMPVQASIPSTLASEGGLFTQTGNSSNSILYFQRDGNVGVNQPVLPMAMASFIVRNTNGVATTVSSFNVTSVTRTATGKYRVVMSTALNYTAGVTEYGVQLTLGSSGAINTDALQYVLVNSTTFDILTFNTQTGQASDGGSRISFVVRQ